MTYILPSWPVILTVVFLFGLMIYIILTFPRKSEQNKEIATSEDVIKYSQKTD